MSWVFLTDDLVYKMKKPVRYRFLDFSTLAARHQDCLQEIRLNRRLAPNVYLGVVPLTQDEHQQLVLEGNGTPVEWLVKMLRLPAERMLDRLIQRQAVSESDVRSLSARLADFYQRAPAEPMTPEEYRRQFLRDIRTNHEELLDHDYSLSAERLKRITEAQLALINGQPKLFDQRIEEKHIIEAHGDLRPEHICLTDEPVFIDCLEFNRKLRILDPAHELAYLDMECEFAGAAFIGPHLFKTYRQKTGDRPADTLLNFYKAYRAILRAKLSIWHIKDHDADQHSKWIKRTMAYLRLAEKYSAFL
ncbi:MAG: hypothetical protein RRB22_14355 [Gammaproteobacteria bacterium]|nr:hypothetical protein [Gammaproteobacteria bacterium]